jgi:archaetidylinositol phosphate synthase
MRVSPAREVECSPSVNGRWRRSRHGGELLADLLFRPLAQPVVAVSRLLRIPPTALVLANAATGLVGAVAIASGQLAGGALLLQLKTVLDNADGQLARVSGRVTAAGRYLDTESDLVVNAAVIGAIGYSAGAPLLAAVAFLALTLVLAVDFNYDVLFGEARGRSHGSLAESGHAVERVLERVYAVVFAPQDRVLRRLDARRLRVALGGEAGEARARATRAYYDAATSFVLSNLGLSTQLAVLGLCLAAGVPVAYLWIVVAQVALLPVLQFRREQRVRKALHT